MVSKGKILGKSSLILLTVGSSSFHFDRLFYFLDKELVKLNENSRLIAQVGNSKYIWRYKNISLFDYLSPDKLASLIKEADKIISHGGLISIYLAVKYSKNNPLIVPRRKEHNEHVDNHQFYFIKFLKEKLPTQLKKYFVDSEVDLFLRDYLRERPKKNTLGQYLFLDSSKKQITKKLEKFIYGSIR